MTIQMPVVTDVAIYPYFDGDGKFLGYASITINNCLVIKSLRICKGRYGMFVAWPKVPSKDGDYHNVAFPITRNFWRYVQETVLQAYKDGNYGT